MIIYIRTQNMSLTNAMRDFTHLRLRRMLSRFAHRITEMTVRFEDVNGPRGGLDVNCRIRLVLRQRGEVNVSGVAPEPGAALSEACERAIRCVRHRVRRRWSLRRRARESRHAEGACCRSSYDYLPA